MATTTAYLDTAAANLSTLLDMATAPSAVVTSIENIFDADVTGNDTNNVTRRYFTPFDLPNPYSIPTRVFLAIIVTFLSIVTIFGNLLVLLSFYLDKKLRTPSNYFLLSLAASDFIIGLEGFPLYSVYVLKGNMWTLGAFTCDLWLAIDYTVCLASIYTVLLITVDRFCSVKIPTTYRNWRTKSRVQVIIIVIWLVPTLLFFVSIMGWSSFVGGRQIQDWECYVQFMMDPIFNMCMYISYYWITLLVMVILYAGIYSAAWKLQQKANQKQTRIAQARAMKQSNSISNKDTQQVTFNVSNDGNKIRNNEQPSSAEDDDKTKKVSSDTGSDVSDFGKGEKRPKTTVLPKLKTPVKKNRGHQILQVASSASFKFWRRKSHGKDQANHKSLPPEETRKTSSCQKSSTIIDIMSAPSNGSSEIDENPIANNVPKPIPPADPPVSVVAWDCNDEISRQSSLVDFPYSSFGVVETPILPNGCRKSLEGPIPAVKVKPFDPFGAGIFSTDLLQTIRYIDQDSQTSSLRSKSPELFRENGSLRIRSSALALVPISYETELPLHQGKAPGIISPLSRVAPVTAVVDPGPTGGDSLPAKDQSPLGSQPQSVDCENAQLLQRQKVSNVSQMGKQAGNTHKSADKMLSLLRINSRRSSARNRIKLRTENRARKALRTITFILGAFILFWTPFYVFATIYGFCPKCVPEWLYIASYYMCYMNSPINPFCYALANNQFKITFTRILKGDFHKA